MMLLAEAALRSSLLTAAVWLALKLLRVRNPHIQLAAWSGVLLASLAMPLLMRWAPAEAVPLPALFYSDLVHEPPVPVPPGVISVAPAATAPAAFPLGSVLLATYLAIALILAARLGLGLIQGLRLLRRASPVDEAWAGGRDIRLSADLAMPAAIGRAILLPADFPNWDTARRQAVLAHESSHVARGDFYLLLLAGLHRALFWFNPLSWWLNRRLADLAEANSDAAALAVAEDRLSYARILIDLAGQSRTLPAGLAMAAHATVRRRVERILAESVLPARLTLGRLTLIGAGLIPATLAVAGVTAAPAGDEARVRERLADQARPRIAIKLDPASLDKFGGYYALPSSPDLPLKVWREGDTLYAAPVGQPGEEYLPENEHAFFAKDVREQVDFKLDRDGHVTTAMLHANGYEFPARRLDEAAGEKLQKALATRIAANQRQPGSERALRTHIDQLQRGAIDDKTMIDGMGPAIRAILPEIQPDMAALGPITQVQFDGVGQDGMDTYTVTHAQGARRWRIRLTQSGRIESMWFTPL